jgi:hypothetical protein
MAKRAANAHRFVSANNTFGTIGLRAFDAGLFI